MRLTSLFPAFVFTSLALAGCAQAPAPASQAQAEPPAAAAQPQKQGVNRATSTAIKPFDQKKYGADITEKTNTALDDLLKQPAKYNTKMVRTEGVVSAVCQGMGCWMELKDEAGQAHIKMAGHSFFVPKNASGHRAVVQGKVVSAVKDHCTEEAQEQTGAVAKVEIEATGVEFID